MFDWLEFHEDKIKVASLIVATLVLLSAIYKWLKIKWRSDVELRKYAYLQPLPNMFLKSSNTLVIEVAIEQHIYLALEQEGKVSTLLHDAISPAGELSCELLMSEHAPGDYDLVMVTSDQKILKRVKWSG